MRTRINYSDAISINDIHDNNLTNLEMEVMSQDLADTVQIEILGNMNKHSYLNLIPKRKMLTVSDIIFFECDYNWCAFPDYKFCDINFDETLYQFNYFNVVLNCLDDNSIFDFKTIISDDFGIVMSFKTFIIEAVKLIHIGILAKTDSDTWKFYPRFHGYQEDLNTLMKNKNSFLY